MHKSGERHLMNPRVPVISFNDFLYFTHLISTTIHSLFIVFVFVFLKYFKANPMSFLSMTL